jgi:hypothetical protein
VMAELPKSQSDIKQGHIPNDGKKPANEKGQ